MEKGTCNQRFGDKWWVKMIGAPLLVALCMFFVYDVNAKINSKVDKEQYSREIKLIIERMDARFDTTDSKIGALQTLLKEHKDDTKRNR